MDKQTRNIILDSGKKKYERKMKTNKEEGGGSKERKEGKKIKRKQH